MNRPIASSWLKNSAIIGMLSIIFAFVLFYLLKYGVAKVSFTLSLSRWLSNYSLNLFAAFLTGRGNLGRTPFYADLPCD